MRRARPLLGLLAGVVIAGAANLAMVGGAGALPQSTVTITADAETSATFGPLASNNPSNQVADPVPTDCNSPAATLDDPLAPPAFFAACDVVPLKIVPPNVSEADDFFVEITVTWSPNQEVEAAGLGLNDLDIYLYDNQQMAKREDPDSVTYEQVGYSAGAVQPETIRIFRPELGDYNLVVNNFSGPNTDYTITGRIIIGVFEQPFEALAPTFVDRGDEGPSDQSGAPPIDFSADVPMPTASNPFVGAFSAASPVVPDIGEIAVLPDGDFDDFAAGSDFANRLSRPAIDATTAAFRAPGPPKPVGAAVLLFWLLFVPLLFAGGGWFILVRRRSQLNFS